jgi:hypothetical protein
MVWASLLPTAASGVAFKRFQENRERSHYLRRCPINKKWFLWSFRTHLQPSSASKRIREPPSALPASSSASSAFVFGSQELEALTCITTASSWTAFIPRNMDLEKQDRCVGFGEARSNVTCPWAAEHHGGQYLCLDLSVDSGDSTSNSNRRHHARLVTPPLRRVSLCHGGAPSPSPSAAATNRIAMPLLLKIWKEHDRFYLDERDRDGICIC